MHLEKKIYLVGGAVRDKLMGIKSSDKDYVAVGYKEKDFLHLHKVGKSFHVYLLDDGSELALARREQKESPGYNGFITDIQNVTLEEDLLRRDLTINSIAYDEQEDSYIDPYNGIVDIQNKILRHTSNSFIEDPIRVLRIARFIAKFGLEWKIASTTLSLLNSMKDELDYLQQERVYKEIYKASGYADFYLFFETLHKLSLLEIIFPSSKTLLDNNTLKRSLSLVKNLSDETLEIKLSGYYYYIFYYSNKDSYHITDMKLPIKVKKTIQFIIQRQLDLHKKDFLETDSILSWIKSFRNDKTLLKMVLDFNKYVVSNERAYHNTLTEEIESKSVIDIFNTIANYSPKEWIESSLTKPSNQEISKHLQSYNVQVVYRYKKLYTKQFILKN